MQEPPLHHKLIGTVVVTVGFCWWLNACATHPAKPPTTPPAAAAPGPCIAVRTYTEAQKDALAAAVAALPPTSPIIPAMGEYAALRKAARAGCP